MRQKLTKAAQCAIIMQSDKHKAAALLQEDIMNGPLHYFGSHHKCNSDYCKVVRFLEKENTNNNDSQSIITCLTYLIDQLMKQTPAFLAPVVLIPLSLMI